MEKTTTALSNPGKDDLLFYWGGLRNLDTTKDVRPAPINPTNPANGIVGYKGSYGNVTFLATTTVWLDRGYL